MPLKRDHGAPHAPVVDLDLAVALADRCFSKAKLSPAAKLLLHQQRSAAKQALGCCAGRMAGGDAPDWLWFRQTDGQQNDGTFAVLTRLGLLVGNVTSNRPPRLLRSGSAVQRWMRAQAQKRQAP